MAYGAAVSDIGSGLRVVSILRVTPKATSSASSAATPSAQAPDRSLPGLTQRLPRLRQPLLDIRRGVVLALGDGRDVNAAGVRRRVDLPDAGCCRSLSAARSVDNARGEILGGHPH